jgi:signal transduction histidine kinase
MDLVSHPILLPSKILIVDDDRLNRQILKGILRTDGFILHEAESGEAALKSYEMIEPDLVLLDVVMPGMDGLQTCRILRDRYGSACAPIIFITAKAESDDVVQGLEAGGVDYLPKPFRPKEALARIRTHLQNRLLVAQLSNANAAKNRFLGMAAHDLRNPLASIRGLAEFLRDGTVGPLTPEQHDLVDSIHEASQSMFDLVNELLDVSVIEAGELQLHFEPVSLADLVEKAIQLGNIQAARKRTRIVFTEGEPPPPVTADPQKIKQVVENLLSNAVKFSPPGAIVTVQTSSDRDGCSFSVRDQGPGIPEDERHKLFQDFGRTSVLPTAGEKSTGLGLAICRKIIDAHHGVIGATNLPGGGSEFKFSLPHQP